MYFANEKVYQAVNIITSLIHYQIEEINSIFSYTFAAIKYIYWITNICLKS